MSAIKQISVLQSDNTYISEDIGADAENIDIDATHTLADKVRSWDNKVDSIEGKELSTNDYTTAEKNKLSGIENNAEVNIIESIQVNGTEQIVENKTVNIIIPESSGSSSNPVPVEEIDANQVNIDSTNTLADKAVEWDNKVDKVNGKGLSTNDYTTAEKTKLAGLSNYDDTILSGKISDIEEVVPTNASASNKLATMADVGEGGSGIEKATYEEAIALKAHAVDDLIYLNNVVYKVTSAIAIGDTITATGSGANVTTDTGLVINTLICIDGVPDNGGGDEGTEVLKPFSTATDQELSAMINGYYNGTISLADIQSVWSVGDTRTVDLSAMSATEAGESHRAQTIEMVILDFDHDTLTTPINGKTKALITIETKNCLRDATVADDDGKSNTENGYMNDSDTNVGGWTSCKRRTWCNNVFYNALPAGLKSMIKQVNKLTSAGNRSETINTDADYIFLPSEIEIFGSRTYSRAGEGTQYEYYKTASNRYKLPKWSSSYVSSIWRERSPRGTDAANFCLFNAGGDANYSGASRAYGLAPAMCL